MKRRMHTYLPDVFPGLVDQTPPRVYLVTYTLPDRARPTWSVAFLQVEQMPHTTDRARAERRYAEIAGADGTSFRQHPAVADSRVWDGDAGAFVRYARIVKEGA